MTAIYSFFFLVTLININMAQVYSSGHFSKNRVALHLLLPYHLSILGHALFDIIPSCTYIGLADFRANGIMNFVFDKYSNGQRISMVIDGNIGYLFYII